MMKIKKIYINNFKGIEQKEIIDFSENTTLLTGPNGFGKTTIFDVLELCITGKIHRTIEKDNVTYDRKDYKKPFYQNTKGKDVVIKVWLEKNDDDLIIVKYLNKEHPGCSSDKGTKNKPSDFELLETFKDTNDNFENISFVEKNNKLSQTEINDFFDFKNKEISIQELYKLFNYLQQEETTYFLKKSEKDRKDSLGFLFQTIKQENKADNIKKYLSKLESIKKVLDEKIDNLSLTEFINKEYIKLFYNKKFEFDRKEPYLNLNIDEAIKKKDLYLDELNKIIKFKETFSPTEYNKKNKFEKISEIITNKDFLNYFILKNYLEDDNYNKITKQYDLYNNDKLLKLFILKNFLSKYEELNKTNDNITKYENFLKNDNFEKKIEVLNELIDRFFGKDKIMEYRNLLSRRKTLQKNSDELSKSLNDILRVRKKLKEEFDDFKEKLNEKSCPFCGHNWESYNNLVKNFENKTNNLRSIIKMKKGNIEEIDNNIIKQFIKPTEIKMKNYCKDNQKQDNEILDLIKQNNITKKELEEITSNFNISKFAWDKINGAKELEVDLENLKKYLVDKLIVPINIYNKIQDLYGKSFNKTFEELKNEISINVLSKYKYKFSVTEKISLQNLENNRNEIIKLLKDTRKLYTYQADKAEDKENIYKIYFDLSEEKINKFNDENVKNKIDYLNARIKEKKKSIVNKYIERRDKLEIVINRVSTIKNIYTNKIKSYKKDMIKRIKTPFYIYTSKILQNYQQGMGVFLSTKENSDSIRFLTDNTSDHDAMHHLSSGQLAVVSLAFCLSINKTYNASDNLKFLAIDDPIQEMDSLNIHSFIELIRNEFTNNYQLIFSTHNDAHALYMKYKLENFNDNSVKIINVQDQFFN